MGFLTVAWIALVSARGSYVEQMSAATQRRIALENSRALAQEFMLERVLPSSSGAAFNYPDSSDPAASAWGGINVLAWGSAPLLSSTKSAGANYFNPGNGDDYFLPVTVTLHDGNTDPDRDFQIDPYPTRTFQIKSRSPLLAGTLLSIQYPTLSSSATVSIASLDVAGAAFLRKTPLSANFTADSYSTPLDVGAISLTNSDGVGLVMNNLAVPRQIANPRSGGADFYAYGQFDAIHNSNPAANSAYTKASGGITVDGSTDSDNTDGVTCDASGNVTITLASLPRTNVYIPGNISTLTIVGQPTRADVTADNQLATLIVVDEVPASTRPLSTVTFSQYNNRRLDLAIKKTTSSTVTLQFSTTSAEWRLLLELENTPVTFASTGTVTLQGGIRSDRTIAHSTGSVRLTAEPDPEYLEQLATRTAWVESYAP